MRRSKKIDDIFRDKFSGIETTPPPDVWNTISERLPEKKKNRILPFLFQLTGAAAVIALAFLLFNDQNGTTTNEIITNNSSSLQPGFQIDISTSVFEELMTNSSKTLYAAVMDTRIKQLKVQLKSGNSGPEQTKILAGAGKIVQEYFEETEQHILQKTNILPNDNTAAPSNPAISEIAENNLIRKDNITKIATASKFEEEAPKKESRSKRFSVTPTAAAVYFNTGSGNTPDDQISGKGSGEISMSYGLNLAYQISDNVKIRSGVNSLNLGFKTRNVNYASTTSSSAISIQENAIIESSALNGSLNQDFSFIEIPVEVEYILLDNKFGVNLIGGASTFFLEENNAVLESPGFSENIGEANNLNKTSFSANFGVGLNYDISPQFRFNMEPIFKYQINTFNSSSNLNSYYFGVYSGLSFKF